ENDPWLDARPMMFHIDFKNLVEIFRRIYLNSRPNRLARLRSAAAPHRQRTLKLVTELDRENHVLARPRDNDPQRFNLIHARISGIQRARHFIETDFARKRAFHFAAKCFDIHPGGLGLWDAGTTGNRDEAHCRPLSPRDSGNTMGRAYHASKWTTFPSNSR